MKHSKTKKMPLAMPALRLERVTSVAISPFFLRWFLLAVFCVFYFPRFSQLRNIATIIQWKYCAAFCWCACCFHSCLRWLAWSYAKARSLRCWLQLSADFPSWWAVLLLRSSNSMILVFMWAWIGFCWTCWSWALFLFQWNFFFLSGQISQSFTKNGKPIWFILHSGIFWFK